MKKGTRDAPRPQIGDRAAWTADEYPSIIFRGVIQDIRPNRQGVWVAYIATVAWPEMSCVPVDDYDWREPDGTWRGCEHPDGFDAAGNCFRCRDRAMRHLTETGAVYA